MKLLTVVTAGLALAGLSCTPANPSARETPLETLIPPVAQPSPTLAANDATKNDFDLAENLTYKELKDISGRVRSDCDRRKLSDPACLTILKPKLRAASIARWQADGEKWVVRHSTSPFDRNH